MSVSSGSRNLNFRFTVAGRNNTRQLQVSSTPRSNGTTVGLSESGNRTSVPRRLNSGRLPGSGRREAWTRQDWISYVSSHLPRVAGRNGSTNGSTAEADATRSHLNHNGPVRQCFSNCEAKSQSANRATGPQKGNESAVRDSIIKGNCEAVPLIGQFWQSLQMPNRP